MSTNTAPGHPRATHEHFSSRLGFLLAAIGTAVGLGNLWKFPYTLGQSGGAAFVLLYVLAVVFVATPIMLSEMIVGRRTGLSPPQALRALAGPGAGAWAVLGWLGIATVFVVLSFFSVVAGWSLAYLGKALGGGFTGLSAAGARQMFADLLASPGQMILWHGVFAAVTAFTVARGITGGIERAVKVLMPALTLLLLCMVGYGMVAGDFATALRYLFVPRPEQLSFAVALEALGQAFFSVNVGVGSVLVYSAYLPPRVNLPRSALWIAAGDTLVALVAGLAIFPIVFRYGIDPAAGPELIFVALSTAFGQMPGVAGSVIGALFFLLVFVAALTSSIAMLELMTSRAEENPKLRRPMMAPVLAAAAFAFGLLTVFSFNLLRDFPAALAAVPWLRGETLFKLLDFAVTKVAMPLGGMGYAIFAGWWLSRAVTREELELGPRLHALWRVFTRWVAPVAIGLVFVFGLKPG